MLRRVSNKRFDFIVFFLEKVLVIARLPCYQALHTLFIKMMIY